MDPEDPLPPGRGSRQAFWTIFKTLKNAFYTPPPPLPAQQNWHQTVKKAAAGKSWSLCPGTRSRVLPAWASLRLWERLGASPGTRMGMEIGIGTGTGMRMAMGMGMGTGIGMRRGMGLRMGMGTGYASSHHGPGKEVLAGTDPCNGFHVPQQSLWLGGG